MKESYRKGVANHPGLEPCKGGCETGLGFQTSLLTGHLIVMLHQLFELRRDWFRSVDELVE
jgi:hypothetical protein